MEKREVPNRNLVISKNKLKDDSWTHKDVFQDKPCRVCGPVFKPKSGEKLTCKLEKGVISLTNASIDRIEAGGEYTKDNVQLVCTVLNGFRKNTSLEEFISWCKKVTNHND